MIASVLIVALLQLAPDTTMTPGSNDRLTAQAFHSEAGIISPEMLLDGAAEEQTDEMPLEDGGRVRLTRSTNAAGQMVILMTPVADSGAREEAACRITEIRPEGENNGPRALQWCANVMGRRMILIEPAPSPAS